MGREKRVGSMPQSQETDQIESQVGTIHELSLPYWFTLRGKSLSGDIYLTQLCREAGFCFLETFRIRERIKKGSRGQGFEGSSEMPNSSILWIIKLYL